MKHRVGFNRIGRRPSHRKALIRNMIISLFRQEMIKTTKAKALATRRIAEKMITRAKNDSVHNRQIVARSIHDKAILNKLFVDIAPRFKERNGGYTQVLKLGQRASDASEMVLFALVERKAESLEKKKPSGRSGKRSDNEQSTTQK